LSSHSTFWALSFLKTLEKNLDRE